MTSLVLKITSQQNVQMGHQATKTFGVEGGSIGRAAGNNWVLPDPARFLSSQHALISFQDDQFLEAALKTANFIESKLLSDEGSLYRNYKNGKVSINAYLEDYSLTISAFIRLYEATFDKKWLTYSEKLTKKNKNPAR